MAENGADALQRALADRPDLVLMDLIMPVMDGVECTRRLMREAPCPVVVVTATVEGNASRVYDAIGAGALDAVETPRLSPEDATSRPFSRPPLKSGDMPRTLMFCALPLPLLRCAATPGRRAIASATEGSGSLPRSSEVIASTIVS